jgi:hypothetical protein
MRLNKGQYRWDDVGFLAVYDREAGFTQDAIESINRTGKRLHEVFNMDAGEAAFFARQLEFIKAKTYDVKFPEYPAQRLLPISTEAGPGAESITYRQYTPVGLMKLLASYADDLPYSDTYGKEFTVAVKGFGGAYRYDIQEIRNALQAGVPLTQRKANSARLAYEQKVNKYGFLADGSATYGGLYGLFYNPNVTKMSAPTGGWCDKYGINAGATPDQIIADVNTAINYVQTLTLKVERVDTVLMPVSHLSYIATVPRSAVSDTTILQFLKNNHPGVEFEGINEAAALNPLPSGASGPANILIAYRKDPDAVTMEIPQPFEQLPVQELDLNFKVPTHARYGGVIFYYPLSCLIMEKI